MKKLLSAVLCFAVLSVAVSSCGKAKTVPLYTGDADFVLAVKREDGKGTLIMDVTRRSDVTEARITSPAELQSVTFSRSSAGSVISSDSASVPLTEDAARGADLVFDILAYPVPDSAAAEKTEHGTQYTFNFRGAEILLSVDGGGTPVKAEITFNGMKRTAEIDRFKRK